ncbi:hypothetical protein GWN42_18935, partial [candidate division KSB1 bacterium]|nr:hypothetical protein [candidate division KSB1 bacterium]
GKNTQITIPEAEVLRFEKINNLIPENQEAPPAAKAWNWIKSPELRIAVEAYYHLYEKDGILPNRGHIGQIKQWLKAQHP